ncbi:MAG: DUF4012 domain-containing protein [Patescibacteria group bacterium]
MTDPTAQPKNLQALKQEFIAELDEFLLEEKTGEKISQPEFDLARRQALAELDRLIKQDLPYAELASGIDKIKRETTEKREKPTNDISANFAGGQQSAHLIDLRPGQQKPAIVKKPWSIKLNRPAKQPKKQKGQASVDKLVLHFPSNIGEQAAVSKRPKIDWSAFGLSHVFSQAAVVGLVTALILLPLRGLVWLGQVQKDKDKLLAFGQQGIFSFQAGLLSASENSYQNAQIDFEQALDNFRQAQGVLNNYQQWLLDVGGQLPILGKSLSVGRNLLSVANNVSEAAMVLNKKIQDNVKLTDYLIFISRQIESTLPYLERASNDLDKMSLNNLPENFRPYFQNLKNDLPATIDNLKNLQQILSVTGELLGQDQEKRYLVLFQNNNELRATGGFIGSYAVLDVYKGQVKNLEIPKGGTYDLTAGQKTKLRAPQALSIINPNFNIWDANWWPDFPTSAKKITWFYNNSGGSSIDGVIAINASVLQELLRIYGPIYMPDYNITIDADNVFAVLQEQVEFKYDHEANTPKAIIADLVPQVLSQLLSRTDKQKETAALMAKLLTDKDIQIFASDQVLQKELSNFGWSGEILSTDKDYLNVVDTNIAGGKTNNDIYQTIEHRAEVQVNGEVIDTVKITRQNQGSPLNPLAGLDGGNVSYLRVYVPQSAELLEANGFSQLPEVFLHNQNINDQVDPDVVSEENKLVDATSGTEIYESLNKTVFANWLTLKPGETKTVTIKYKLPFKLDLGEKLVNDWRQIFLRNSWQLDHYGLLVQSQSGNHNNVFSSEVILPTDCRVAWTVATDPEQIMVNDNSVYYSDPLDKDQYYGFVVAKQK